MVETTLLPAAPWAALALLIPLYFLILYYFYQKGRSLCLPNPDFIVENEDRLKSLRKGLSKYFVEESSIEISEDRLGGGSGGFVFRGFVLASRNVSKQPAALKLPIPIPSSSLALLEEAARLVKVNHPNIVRIIAVSWPQHTLRPIVALEWLPGGSLQDYFRNHIRCHEDEKVRPAVLLKDILNILLQHLHETMDDKGRELVHGDIASRNVLLTKKDLTGVTVKLGDLGTPEGIRPVAWLPPEIVCAQHSSPKITQEGDIWMFGVFAWECLTLGATPHYQRSVEDIQKSFRLPNRGLSCPHSCPLDVWTMILECFSEAHRRPRLTGNEGDGSLLKRVRTLRDLHSSSMHRVFVVANVSSCTCPEHRCRGNTNLLTD